MVIKKFNWLESAQKIHASRDWCNIHVHQFASLVSEIFQTMDYIVVHGGQRIESVQKIHASKGWCEMHGNEFWWAWLSQFQRFCSFSVTFKNGQFFLLTMDYCQWGSKIESTMYSLTLFALDPLFKLHHY